MKGQIESLRDHYILCGFGRVGEEIAREFSERRLAEGDRLIVMGEESELEAIRTPLAGAKREAS